MVENVCYSCEIFSVFNAKTLRFCERFFDVIVPDVRMMLTSLVTLWIVWQLCMCLLTDGDEFKKMLVQFIDLSVASVLLSTFSYWNGVFFWLYDFGMYVGAKVISITSDGTVPSNATNTDFLLFTIEQAFTPILERIGIMVSDISWSNLKISLSMIPVAVIYFLLLWRMFNSLFAIFVQMFALSLMAPFLCAFYALPPVKQSLFSAIRTALTNAFQIILACGTMGIILSYLSSLSMFEDKNVNVSVGTVGYMQLLFTGALLWGAYGVIIKTPYTIFNAGSVDAPNTALSYLSRFGSRLPKALSFMHRH